MVFNPESQYGLSAPGTVLRDRFPFFNTVGPLERWEDDNYRPQSLKAEILKTETHFLVKTELPDVQPEQVKVNLYRGTLFILVSSTAANGETEEAYAEISIPARYRSDKARTVLSYGTLIIAVPMRRPSIMKQLLTSLSALFNQSRSPKAQSEGMASGD